MEDEQLELIDRYLRGDLSPEEKAAFEARLSTDADFRRELELQRHALEAIRMAGREQLKARLSEHGKQQDSGKKKPVSRGWGLGLISIAAAFAVWWFWPEKNQGPSSPTNNSPLEDSLEQPDAPDRDTLFPENKKDQIAPPIAEKQVDSGQLFAEYFKPYKDPSLEPSVRGSAAPTPYEQFLQQYWDGEYAKALETFETLDTSIRENDNNRFLIANCLMTVGRQGEAAPILESLVESSVFRFRDETPWYLALCYLKSGEKEKARDLLTKSPRPESQRLLRQL